MTLKIALPDLISNSYVPADAAVELGFFKNEGIDAEVEMIVPVDEAYEATSTSSSVIFLAMTRTSIPNS
ncbi:MAG: hypothetical protein K2Z80_31875 [Xanthobacteraceae bacterium]|nr:hypothetical protein [Xanthobacteraceae bacterium]MBX9846415.1 hypothetical protein [Xanthobacteraceae bacterium]